MKALWAYRSSVWSNVLREFDGRYHESLWGTLWSVANPLATIVMYTVISGQPMKPTLPGDESTPFAFNIDLCAGVLTWALLAEMLSRLNNLFLERGNLIKKANFPRIRLSPIVYAAAAMPDGVREWLRLNPLVDCIGPWTSPPPRDSVARMLNEPGDGRG